MLCRIVWLYGAEVVLYISGVGFCVARLRLARHFLQPLTVKRATVQGFTLFYVLLHRFNRGVALAAYRWAAYGG